MRLGQRVLRACRQGLVLLLCVLPIGMAPIAGATAAHTILILGDSISAGYGIQREAGWVHLLADRLDGRARVVNASVSGETTGGGVARIDAALQRHRPDIVVIELGGNDGLRGYPVERIRSNLERIVRRVQSAGATPLLVGMHIPPNYGERYTTAFHDTYADIAARLDVALVPFLLEGVATVPGLMQADGVHPVAAAQPRMLENLWPVLRPLLVLEPQGTNETGGADASAAPLAAPLPDPANAAAGSG